MRLSILRILRLKLFILFSWVSFTGASELPNVLFIAVDDLRPMLGCYGEKAVSTPNIDQIAQRGTVFRRAYCQTPQCSPSRVSLMTGLRPETTGHYSNRDEFKHQNFKKFPTLPEHFKNHGYHAQSYGKIYHDGADIPSSWSVLSSPGREREMWETVDENAINKISFDKRIHVPTIISPRSNCVAIQAPDVPDEGLYAGRMTTQAIKTIAELKGKPFFLAVGYRRPHLPLVAPKKYFDLYPKENIRLPRYRQPPRDVPLWSIYNTVTYWHPNARELYNLNVDIPKYPRSLDEALRFAGWELRSYQGIPPSGFLSNNLQKAVWQAYLACVSYVDSQVGRLIRSLEENGLSEKTIVVLWGDHGWHLGEHGTWAKMTLFEWSTRVPLVLMVPSLSQPGSVDSLVELVDVYPTLCQLAGLPIPDHIEGDSVVPILQKPSRPWKSAAFSKFPRYGHSMGHTMRTDRYRYTEWIGSSKEIRARELYDHHNDPNELINLAGSPKASAILEQLEKKMKAGWVAARPKVIH